MTIRVESRDDPPESNPTQTKPNVPLNASQTVHTIFYDKLEGDGVFTYAINAPGLPWHAPFRPPLQPKFRHCVVEP
jgi:hypothetical protein